MKIQSKVAAPHQPFRGFESMAEITTGMDAADSSGAARRQWTVLRQLDGILNVRHLQSDSDYDQICQPLATTEPAATYRPPSGTRSCARTRSLPMAFPVWLPDERRRARGEVE
jgi:hypothetical protein